jgi:hypothetical protein
MCIKKIFIYRDCPHRWAEDINKCAQALARKNERICTPQEAWAQEGINMQLNVEDAQHQRFLPMNLDVQNQNQDGRCPACLGKTPPSSRDSM